MNRTPQPHVLLLLHAGWELPGIYGEILTETGWQVSTRALYLGAELDDIAEVDGIVVMGGPMSADDAAAYPWLITEKLLLGNAVRAGTPVFGVCLGAQLLAASLGGRIHRAARPEFGLSQVWPTADAAADPLFFDLAPATAVFHWHGDSFELPPGATLLATSEPVRHQAFRVAEHAYGLQFHAELTPALFDRWLTEQSCRAELISALDSDAPDRLATELDAAEQQLRELATRLFSRWLRLVEATR
ncbi:MAG: type 1 glutamine amidotransferase [Jatrophihabitantaceae bacterium]